MTTFGPLLLALSLSQASLDAGIGIDEDAGVEVAPSPSVALLGTTSDAVVAWLDDRRRRAFGDVDGRRPGVDLWTNTLTSTGLARDYGVLTVRQSPGVILEHPSLSQQDNTRLLAWVRHEPGSNINRIESVQVSLSGNMTVPQSPYLIAGRAASLVAVLTRSGPLFVWEEGAKVRGALPALGNTVFDVQNRPSMPWQRPSAAAAPSASSALAYVLSGGPPFQVTTISGLSQQTPSQYFFGAREARLVGSNTRSAFISGSGLDGDTIDAGTALFIAHDFPGTPLPVVPNAVAGLLAAYGPSGNFHLVYRTATREVRLARYQSLPAMEVALPMGAVPLAVAEAFMSGDTVIAAKSGANLGAGPVQLLRVAGSTGAGNTSVPYPLAHDDDQLAPGVVFRETGDFAVAWTVVPQSGAPSLAYLTPPGPSSNKDLGAGTYAQLAPSIEGPEGVSVVGPSGSAVFENIGAVGGVNPGAPLLSSPSPALSRAAVGRELAVQWDERTGHARWGRDDAGVAQARLLHQLGRCAAWQPAQSRLLIPGWSVSPGTAHLAIAVIPDDLPPGLPAPDAGVVISGVTFNAGAQAPCLALQGASALVVFETSTGTLGAALLSIGNTLGVNPPLTGVRVLMDLAPGAVVTNPVVAGSAGDWFIAWETANGPTSEVFGCWLRGDGGVLPAQPLSSRGADARNPSVAAAPSGEVLVAWHEFREDGAHTEVEYQTLSNPFLDGGQRDGGADGGFDDAGATDGGFDDAGAADGGFDDAGVADGGFDAGGVDAGLRDAGGAQPVDGGSDDGGAMTPPTNDGGTSEPPGQQVFTSCGCTSGAEFVFALAALGLMRRRRDSSRRA